MPLRRALLASAATPILALALSTGSGPATAAERGTASLTTAPVLLAQADSGQNEELRKRKQRQQGDDQKQQGSQPEKQKNADESKPETPKRAQQPEAAKPKKQEQAQPKEAPAPKKQAEPKQEAQPKKEAQPKPEAQPKKQAQPKPEAQPKHEAQPKKQAEPKQEAQPKKAAPEPKAAETPKPKGAEKPEQKSAEPAQRSNSKDNAGGAERNADDNRKIKRNEPKSDETAKPAQGNEKPAEKNAVAPSDEKAQPPRNAEGRQKPGEAGKPKGAPEGDNARQAQPNGEKAPGAKGEPAQAQGENGKPKLAPVKSLNDHVKKKASEPIAADAKPQLLDVPNGAPVLDSAKRDEVRGGRGRNRDRDQARDRDREDRNGERRADRERRDRGPVEIRSVTEVEGERIQEAPRFRPPESVKIEKEVHNRYIVNVDNRTYIENNDYDRISRRARDTYYERLPQGNAREVVVRPNGVRVVTIRNEYGDILQRSRIVDGQETVLIYAPDYDRGHHDRFFRPVDLPPIQLTEPVDEYILVARDAEPEQYVTFLEKPPIEPVEQVYTVDQVRYSARLRDIMPRIDLDTITFATGSADVQQSQSQSLEGLAAAINDVLKDDPGQVFLIEGHTDAVGSAESNLVLSDQRAESVAAALTQDFDVPPENLVTQGYGEQYLKVETEDASRVNRRVAIRRITPLVRPTAQN